MTSLLWIVGIVAALVAGFAGGLIFGVGAAWSAVRSRPRYGEPDGGVDR